MSVLVNFHPLHRDLNTSHRHSSVVLLIPNAKTLQKPPDPQPSVPEAVVQHLLRAVQLPLTQVSPIRPIFFLFVPFG